MAVNLCLRLWLIQMKGIQGVNKIKDGYNPATWMLEVTTPAQEDNLGINFVELYKNSDLYLYGEFL